jgi:hypothetical protein
MVPISKTVLSLVVASALGWLGSIVQAEVFTIETDDTWKMTSITPNTGWNTSINYDDSNWGNARFDGVTYTFPDGMSWHGIWSDPWVATNWFRKTFVIPGTPISAFLDFGDDDDADVFINGIQVINDHNGRADDYLVTRLDITSLLETDQNLIAVNGTDVVQRLARIMGGMTITYNVPEPASLALLGSSAAALLISRHVRKWRQTN